MHDAAISPDPRIPGYFDEWCRMRLARYGVGWKTYRDARLEGERTTLQSHGPLRGRP